MKKIRYAMLCAAVLASVGATTANAADAGAKQRTLRGRLVHDIVMKWANHVQEAYRADVRKWADNMGPSFAKASIDDLQRAADAPSFEAMNQQLLGASAAAPTSPTPASAKTQIRASLLGDTAADLVYVPVTPCRIIDTRVVGGAIAANSTRDFDITGVADFSFQGGASGDCAIGSVGSFAAAAINFVVVTPNAAGYITAFPYLATQPLASTVNYVAGDVRSNLAIVKIDQGPSTPEMSVYSFAQTHLVADVVGYFITPQATNLNCVNTGISTFTILANSTNFFNNPSCPAGYSATTPYCWTASSGVYSQGSGYNANASSNQTFCSWQNTTAADKSVFGGNVCCRVPGR